MLMSSKLNIKTYAALMRQLPFSQKSINSDTNFSSV